MQAIASGNWSSPPVFTVGAQANLAALQLQRVSVATLSSSSFLYAYIEFDSGISVGNLRAVVGTVSGTAITFGTPVLIRSGLSPQGVGCCALSSTSAIVTYGNSSSIWAGAALTISGTTITVGSEATTGTVASGSTCVALTSTTALCTDDYGNKARVATISGTSFTWGPETTFGSTANYGYVTSASPTTGVVARVSSGVGLVATALTISGTTITAGTPTVIDPSAANDPFGIQAVSATSVIASYSDSSNSFLRAAAISISGTTITVGTPVTLSSFAVSYANFNSGPVMAALSSSRALVTFRNSTASPALLVGVYLNLSGTTVSSSSAATISSLGRAPSVTNLGSNIAVVGYGDSTTNISARVLTLT